MKRLAISVLFPISLTACAALVPSPRAATPTTTFEPLVITHSGDEPAPARPEVIQLPEGNYVMQWEARRPLQPGWDRCGVEIDLQDSNGESVMDGGISELLDQPAAGHAMMPDLPSGEYVLWVDIGCPFRVSLTPY